MSRYRSTRMKLADGSSVAFAEPTISPTKGAGSQFSDIVTRQKAHDFYNLVGYLPNPDKILRKLNKDIDEYEQLMSDARVKGAWNSRKAGLLGMEWRLERGTSAARQYSFLSDVMASWPMHEIMGELVNGAFYGYQPAEIIWAKVGGNVVPSNLVPKPARWFRYDWKTNALLFLTKEKFDGEYLPPHKFVVARLHPSYDDPYGESLASAVYWPVKFKHLGWRYFATFIERYGMPWIKTTYPSGAQEARVSEMVSMMSKGVQDNIIAYPTDYTAEALNLNDKSSSDIYKAFIELCDQEISIALLGGNLTTQVKGGSFAAAEVHNDIRGDLIHEDIRMVETTIQQVIDWAWVINYGNKDTAPRFCLSPKIRMDQDSATTAKTLVDAGVQFKDIFWQDRFGIKPEELVSESEREAKALQEQEAAVALATAQQNQQSTPQQTAEPKEPDND